MKKTPVINYGKAAALGRACGYFCQVLLVVGCCFKRALLGKAMFSGGAGWGWMWSLLQCSACRQIWRCCPACMDQVSTLALVGSSFSSDLGTLEFPLLKKWIILICILLKPCFILVDLWSLQGACCREGDASFRVLAWAPLALGRNSSVSITVTKALPGSI